MKEENIERIAVITHEVNRVYCQILGDTSQEHWPDSPRWQKDSAIEGVKHALAGATPEQLHQSWMAKKLADGWVLGDIKDELAKTHPCLKPYEELFEDQKMKDQIFSDTVRFVSDIIHKGISG